MNFKEIRLVGFKSFADKTSIKFDDGVTCIVGPNGCGKSNVADAVRWVLGEQSAKSMRGTTMQDVIFSGTETRRQLSYCEVTLVFDNSDKMFDIEYDEVAMTRRLYRSGDSEYLLNMQPCLRRELVSLLHGVGVGREGYSIIGQGQVEQIISAKPEDRRAIFEEATGVMQFKQNKADIERRLQSARDDLAVFVQRMDEAEKMLHPLEKQAETARKAREYGESLRYEEINAYLVRSDSFAYDTERSKERIAAAQKTLSEVEGRLAEIEKEKAEGRERASESDEKLRSLNEKRRLFEVGMEHKSGEAKVINTQISAFRTRLAQASDEIGYSMRRSKEIETLISESGKARAKRDARAAQIAKESAELTVRLEEANERVAAQERITDEKRASELSTVENLADIRVNVGSLSARRDEAQGRIEEVRGAIEKAEGRRAQYAAQLAACRKDKAACEKFLDESSAREKELTEEISDLTELEKKLTEEIVNCNTTIANLTNNRELYIGLKNRFNGYRDSVRNLQIKAKSDPEIGSLIKGAIADIVSTDKKYEVAIETAFGAAMQNLVTATADDARRLIEYLKRTGGGVVTFLPVDGMRPRGDTAEIRRAANERGAVGLAADLVRYDAYYDNVVRNLLDNTLICDDIASATEIAKRYPRAFKIVTLDGDIISTSGAMTGGSRRKESGNLLAGERYIKECEEGIARKEAEVRKLTASLERASAELETAKKSYEEFRLKVQQETANFAALSQNELAVGGLIGAAEEDVKEYSALLETLTRKVDDLESEVQISAENEGLLNKIREEAAQEAQARGEEAGKLREKRDGIAAKLHDLRVEGAAIASTDAAEEENGRRLAAEKEELARKVEEIRQSIAETEERIAALEREEERAALTEDELRTLEAIRARLMDVENEKKEEAARQQAIAEEERGLLTRQRVTTEEKNAAEIEISKAETMLESMRQRLEETYGLDYESAVALRDPDYDISQANVNISSLRHKIAALGSVNQNAEADYAELLARYTEMQTQRQDLEKGIDDLTTVLNELRDNMQKKFEDGFNSINANFSQVFKELFGGGRAEMQLDYTDCTDPLEAGIEITACPPGKKLSKISLLSGGERAITAIAILFAILKTSPMPFCILDEIDAALDDANVNRFAKYLKKFSKETQFIVITHRKPTMNQTDTLFGVTMEEKGVSKIVSVKLSEVESRLGGDTVVN